MSPTTSLFFLGPKCVAVLQVAECLPTCTIDNERTPETRSTRFGLANRVGASTNRVIHFAVISTPICIKLLRDLRFHPICI